MGPPAPGSPPRRSREHRLFLALCLAFPLALLAVGRLLEPDPRGWGTHEQLGFQPCFPMRAWNVPCPGCGVTTAVALAARGHGLAALRVQPLGPLLVAAALGLAGWALFVHARGGDLAAEFARWRWKSLGLWLATLALLAWIYKLAALRGWL